MKQSVPACSCPLSVLSVPILLLLYLTGKGGGELCMSLVLIMGSPLLCITIGVCMCRQLNWVIGSCNEERSPIPEGHGEEEVGGATYTALSDQKKKKEALVL